MIKIVEPDHRPETRTSIADGSCNCNCICSCASGDSVVNKPTRSPSNDPTTLPTILGKRGRA